MTGVLIKISGAWLGGEAKPFDYKKYLSMAEVLKETTHNYQNMSLVVGGGNVIRGKDFPQESVNLESVDYVGMLASIQNALLLRSAILSMGRNPQVIVPDIFSIPETMKFTDYLKKEDEFADRTKIFGGGVGICGCSTDMAAVKIALCTNISRIIFLKNGVDGLYDKDPYKAEDAKFINQISYQKYCEKRLTAIDIEAVECLMNKGIKAYVAGCSPRNLQYLLMGHLEDTVVNTIHAGGFDNIQHYTVLTD